MVEMTRQQKAAIEFAKREILKNDGHNSPDYEYKQWAVTLHDWGKVEIRSEVGQIGDEGTYAQLLARTRRQIFVGPRGGYTLANPGRYVGKGENIRKFARKGWVTGPRALWTVTI